MTVEALQAYLQSLEKDYQNIVKASDEKMQHLQKEKHDVHARWCKSQKAKEDDKVEIATLKRKIDVLENKNLQLKCDHQRKIDDLQEEMEFCKKEVDMKYNYQNKIKELQEEIDFREKEIDVQKKVFKRVKLDLRMSDDERHRLEDECTELKGYCCKLEIENKRTKAINETFTQEKEKKETNRHRTRYKR